MKPLFLALALAASLPAASIPLFNTGTDASNLPLGPQDSETKANLLDTHFSLISAPGSENALLTRWQFPYFSEAGLEARWISPAVMQFGAAIPPTFPGTVGNYVFEQTFDMTPFDISTAMLSGRMGADNCAVISLNSTVLASTGGSCPTGSSSNFTTLTSFSASSSAFIAGINTLRIDFANFGGPAALLVTDLQGTADPAVPEPSTYALIGASLIAIQIRRKLT